jgi:Domain of unknown function (DUF4395)
MFGEHVEGYAIPVLNEREVRAGAGILFFITLTVFLGAWHADQLLPAQMMIVGFFLDFLIRVLHPRYSPSLILGRIAVGNQAAEYTAAAPKRFAWILGLVLASIMLVTLIFLRNMSALNFAICGVCILLLFMESSFGICLGCIVYHRLCKQNLELCPGGVCEVRTKEPIRQVSARQVALLAGFSGAMVLTLVVMQEQNQAHADHGANHRLLQEIQGKPGAASGSAPARGEEQHRH